MRLLLLKSGIMPMARMIHLIISDDDDDGSHDHDDDDTTIQVLDETLIPFMVRTTMDDTATQVWEKDQSLILCERG